MPKFNVDYLLLGLLALVWSASFLLIKVAVPSIPPFTLTASRLVIAAVLLSAYLALRRETIPLTRPAVRIYVVAGILGNCLPFILISWGETLISSSLTALLMGVMPVSTFVLAHFFIHAEPMTRRKLLGVGLGFLGLGVLVGVSTLDQLGQNLLGQAAVIGGVLCYSVTTVFIRRQPAFPGHQLAAGMMLVAAAVSAALAFALEDPLTLTPAPEALRATALLGVFSTAAAALIYFRVIRNLGATTFAQINYVIPVLGAVWGVAFLGETLGLNVFIALGLVLWGIYLIQRTGN